MQYLLLIYGDEKAHAEYQANTPGALETEMEEYNAYTAELGATGFMRGGEALYPTSAATTIRVRDGKTLTTHGPFAETKEQLGGFYIVECENLDQAIHWAAKIPGAREGSIEVRPIVDFSAPA